MNEFYNNTDIEQYAVYGTLRQGFGNHRILNGNSDFIGETIIHGFKMYTNEGFPMIIPSDDKSDTIVAEIYCVTDGDTKVRLDMLEGYSVNSDNGMYLRRKINTEFGESWIYIWNRSILSQRQIKDGDFKKDKKKPVLNTY